MSTKGERHQEILDIIQNRVIATQNALQEGLRARGHEVTQPTLSRDCEELGLRKVRDEQGQIRYAPAEVASATERLERVALVLDEFVLSMAPSGTLLALRTPRGAAGPVACVVDAAPLDEIVATIAGEDTLLLVVRDGLTGREVEGRLRRMIAEHARPGKRVDLDRLLSDVHGLGHEADDAAVLMGLRAFRSRGGERN